MSVHEDLVSLFETYVSESDRYEKKGIKVARVRARKALSEIAKLSKERRKELSAAEGDEKEEE